MSYYQAMARPKRRRKLPSDVHRHFLKRLKERYDIEITRKDCKELEKRKAKFYLQRESYYHWWYLLRINDQWVYCLYQRYFGLTTALTPEQFWESHPNLELQSHPTVDLFVEAWAATRADKERFQQKNKVCKEIPVAHSCLPEQP